MWSTTLKTAQRFIPGYTDTGATKKQLSRVKQGLAFIFIFALANTHTHADIYFSSRTIGPSTNIYSVDSQGRISRITDNELWKDAEAKIALNGDIVFMSNRKETPKIDLYKQSEDFNIFKTSLKDKTIQQLTFSQEFDHSPTISNDGEWITWLQKAGNYRKLMLLKNGETTPTSIAIANDIFSVDWAPNNRVLSFTSMSEEKSQLFIYDIDTHRKMLLLEVPTTADATAENSLDKTSIASYNTLLKKRENTNGSILSSAQWSPDGKKIAYIRSATRAQQRELFVLDLWAKTNTAISADKVQVQQPVSWSPDSKSVAYSGLIGYKFYFDEQTQRKVYEGSMQIFLADMQGSITQLTNGNNLHNRPAFSPDGTHIAFLFGQTLGDRTLALHTLDLATKQRDEHYDRVAGDSYLVWH